VALVGGGMHPQPGEISLAHNGMFHLDELPEFKRTVLEVMYLPLEEQKVNISRAQLGKKIPQPKFRENILGGVNAKFIPPDSKY